jgi:hemolysin III
VAAEVADLPARRSPGAARLYDRAERGLDAAIHLSALGAAAAAVPGLVIWAAIRHGGLGAVAGVALYGATLIAMLACSYLYNHLDRPHLTNRLRRLDMSAIFVKIAGTVTPFALLSGTGKILLATIWLAAALGVAAAVFLRRHPTFLSVAFGLGMGWGVLVAGRDVLASTSWSVLGLMLAGGLFYSLGTPFLMRERMRFHNAIWHGFVVAGSVAFFAAIALHAAQTGAMLHAAAMPPPPPPI